MRVLVPFLQGGIFGLGIISVVFMCVMLCAHAHAGEIEDSFWRSYNAAAAPSYAGAIIAEQRNTEAIVNEMRAARGQPPCSIGLLGQWQGRPAC